MKRATGRNPSGPNLENLKRRLEEQERLNKTLKSRDHLHRVLFENSDNAIMLTMTDGTVLSANPRACEMLGMTEGEIKAAGRDGIVLQDQQLEAGLKERARTGRFRGELTLLRKDGTRVPVEVTSNSFEDEDGTAKSALVLKDISERKSAAQQLRFSEEQLRRTLEEAPIPIIMYTEDGETLQISRKWTELTGFRLSDIPTLDTWLAQSYGDGANALRTHLPLLFNDREQLMSTELQIKTRDGNVRHWVFSASSPGILRDGRRFIVAMAQDITERKKAEQELSRTLVDLEKRVEEKTLDSQRQMQRAERERDRLAALIESMTEGVWFARSDGTIVLANSVARQQAVETGIGVDSLYRTPSPSLLSQVELLTPDGSPLDMAPLMRVFQGESFRGVEIIVRNKGTGEVFHRRISANSIYDASKQVEGAIVIVQDITPEKAAEEEKARLEEQLRQSQKMEAVGTLAGGIAHDFNNMLAVIIGNAELTLDDLTEEGPRHNTEQIIKASKRARDLVKQILTFSRRNGQGKNSLRLTPLVQETFNLLRGSLPSTIRMDLDIHTQSDTVVADPSQIQQVIMNLATNAASAMSRNGGTLTFSVSDVIVTEGARPDALMSPGAYVRLSVRDTGTGMTEKVRQRIFEPFFTTKGAGQGTGMGLSVAYGIVKNHDGAITVESRRGVGSTFNVFLPRVDARPKQDRARETAIPRGKERILVVDDEPGIVDVVSRTLQGLGYQVTPVQSGLGALKLFQEDPSRFDLVVTDQTMPDLTGIDLARKMLGVRKDIPVILFTGYSESVSPEKAKKAGIKEFLMKPLVKQEVAQTVRRVLDKNK